MHRFPTPCDPRVGAWGAPNTPKSPPPRKKLKFFASPPPIFVLFCFKTPGRCFCGKQNSVIKNFHQPPNPYPHAPAQPSEHSPQSWCNNKYSQQLLCEIWTTTTNTSNKYTMSAMSLYTSSSLSINDHLECSRTIYNHCICITMA